MHEVESRVLEEQMTAVMRGKMAVKDIPAWLGMAYHTVATHLDDLGMDAPCLPFARYTPLDSEYAEFEIEAGFPVPGPFPTGDGVELSTLPAGPAAVVWHVGPYEDMEPAYEALLAWISEHGGTLTGSAWEVYHSDPKEEPEPTTWRTEIIQPYRLP